MVCIRPFDRGQTHELLGLSACERGNPATFDATLGIDIPMLSMEFPGSQLQVCLGIK